MLTPPTRFCEKPIILSFTSLFSRREASSRQTSLHAGPFLAFMLLVSAMFLAGCKAKPAPDAGFLEEPEKMTKQERYPFHRAYWNKQFDPKRYTELLVRPVDTWHMLEQNFWQEANIRNDQLVRDAFVIANEIQLEIEKAARNDPKKRFTLVQKAGPKTLVLEMALVELVPNKVSMGALGLASLGISGGAGVAAGAVGGSGKGTIAFEARIRDGATDKVIGMFADREEGATAPVDIGALTWYNHAHTIIKDWAEQLIELANTPEDHIVKDSSPFTLLPW